MRGFAGGSISPVTQ